MSVLDEKLGLNFERNGHVDHLVTILPHVTPSPRVPAADQSCGLISLNSLESSPSFALLGRDGSVECTRNHLPHVTPSPRVPAANQKRRSASPSFYITDDALLERDERTECTRNHLPHVTPPQRVPAAN
jgi:hypothetical protein